MASETAENIARNGVDYIEGAASLQPDGALRVAGTDGRQRKLRAKKTLIATGSRPRRPKNISFEIPGVSDTDTILNRGRPPRDILIVGGGPVGVEFATICHALGAKVAIADLGSRLIPAMDGEVSGWMGDLFHKWGITVYFGSTVENIEAGGDALWVKLSKERTLYPDTVLFAAGRVANTDGLGLEAVGITSDSRGRIIVDRNFQTTADGIYAAGDVVGPTLASIGGRRDRISHAVLLTHSPDEPTRRGRGRCRSHPPNDPSWNLLRTAASGWSSARRWAATGINVRFCPLAVGEQRLTEDSLVSS